MKRIRIAAAAFLAALAVTPLHAGVITLGYAESSVNEVPAELIKNVLERMGINVSLRKSSESQIFSMLREGEIDFLVGAWLPNAHAQYWEAERMVKLVTLYDDAKFVWAVPAYVPASELSSLADLRKPAVAEKMVKRVRTAGASIGLNEGSKKVFDEYALGELGYRLTSDAAAHWRAGIKEDFAARRWFVAPLPLPHYLNRDFRPLDEPKQLLGGSNKANLLASKATLPNIDKAIIALLKRISVSTQAVAEMDFKVQVEGRTPHEAARRWMGEHPNTIEYWYTPEDDTEK